MRITGPNPYCERCDGSGQLETTSQHNTGWRTFQPCGCQKVAVDFLEIDHQGGGIDGYPTVLRIDGKTLPELGTAHEYLEKIVYVEIECGKLVEVEVDTAGGHSVLYISEQFKMDLGDIRVETHPDHFPCSITVNGYEPKVTRLGVIFEEGNVPLVGLILQPSIQAANTPVVKEVK